MKFRNDLLADDVRKWLHYDPDTGRFQWIDYPGPLAGIMNGLRADARAPFGYRDIRIFDFNYKAHRIAWLYMHGRWPEHFIDHANRVRSDNRIENLREATGSQNMANKAGTRLGLKGVSVAGRRWRATVYRDGQIVQLGSYSTEAFAHEVYKVATRYIHGEFANFESVVGGGSGLLNPYSPGTVDYRMREYILERETWRKDRSDWPAGVPEDIRDVLQRELGDRDGR